jgi:DNA-binding NarL/FixJ family response regulator
MNEFWNTVLTEVLHKDDPHYPAFFTNTTDHKISKKTRQTQDVTLSKQSVAKKHTQLTSSLKKYTLGEKYPNLYLTKREAQVIVYYIHGMSTAQVAKALELSRRTVEFYINNMKLKLDCRFKRDLIYKIINSDFLKNIDFHINISAQDIPLLLERTGF